MIGQLPSPPPRMEQVGRSVMLARMAVVGAVAYVVVLAWSMEYYSYNIWGGLLVAAGLSLVTLPVALRLARAEDDPRLARLLLFALAAKFVGTLVRYFVAFEVYDGVADAGSYHNYGTDVAASFRAGDFDVDIDRSATGTGFIRLLTGWVYTVTGPTKLGGFLVFSWLGFWGLYLFYRAFRTGFPDGDRRRYALLVFFLPSLVFWPSSIGKDAWMTLALGTCAYGVARISTKSRGGFSLLVVGLWGTAMVRAHVAVLVLLAAGVAYLLRRTYKRTTLGPLAKVAGMVSLVLISVLVLARFEDQFGVRPTDTDSVEQVLDDTNERSADGGSSFEAVQARSPADLPAATVAVLFRPFPHEAHNVQALFASMEGTALLVLTLASIGRLRRLPTAALRHSYVMYVAVYSAAFVYAFSTIGNFGIIARQRVQLFPLVLVLLAVRRATEPTEPHTPTPGRGAHKASAKMDRP